MKNKEITILLVDDEPDILEIVRYNLTAEGYKVKTAENGAQAVSIAKKTKPQLILMDVMMPKMNGMEACKEIRKIPELSQTVIAFLTARGEEHLELQGFDMGADDYITKPIKPKVLVGRVKGLLRRFKLPTLEKETRFGDLTIVQEGYKIILGKEEVILPKKEFELLCLLASRPGKVFKREDILNKIWGMDVIVGDRTIDVHIRKLREKIGDDKFKTVKGVGYSFVI